MINLSSNVARDHGGIDSEMSVVGGTVLFRSRKACFQHFRTRRRRSRFKEEIELPCSRSDPDSSAPSHWLYTWGLQKAHDPKPSFLQAKAAA